MAARATKSRSRAGRIGGVSGSIVKCICPRGVKTGYDWSVMAALEVEIWRGEGNDGSWRCYAVPHQANQTVLDVVTHVQRHIDPSLAYRFACRVGMCGSCAMTVNGRPRWTCRTHVSRVSRKGRLRISPLRNLPVIRDLAVDMAPFFEKWRDAEARFVPSPVPVEEPVRPGEPARKAADAGIECINCAICYAACDSVAWNPDYPGPAALNRLWTLVNDRRDGDQDGHLEAAGTGCHLCRSHQECAEVCPTNLNPTTAIAGLKREVFRRTLARPPWEGRQ